MGTDFPINPDATNASGYMSSDKEKRSFKAFQDGTWQEQMPGWLLTLAPSTAVTLLTWTTEALYEDGTVAAVALVSSIAAGTVAVKTFQAHTSPALQWASLALSTTCVQVFVTVIGDVFVGFLAWTAASCGAIAARLMYRYHTRYDRMEEIQKTARAETALIRQQMAAQQLAKATAPEAPGPDLYGRTPEESSLRRVIYELFAVELPGCQVDYTPTGWTATITLPVALDRKKFRSSWDRISSGLGLNGAFRLDDGVNTNQIMARFVEGDPLSRTVPWSRPAQGKSFRDPVYLGVDMFLEDVWLDMAYSHTLIAGSSKFGKSTITRSIAVQLADRDDVVLYGMDLKPGAPELSPMIPILSGLASTPEQAHSMLDWLREELEERGEMLKKAGDQEWDPDKHGRPAMWIIEDELAELIRQGDTGPWKKNPASKKQESLLALMRFAGMHLISATQQPSRKVFGGTTDARGNYANRISTRMNDADHRRFVFGNTPGWEPGELDQPGKFMLQSPDFQRPAHYKGVYLSGDEFRGEVARIGAKLADRKTSQAPSQKLLLPVEGSTNQERVRNALAAYGALSRGRLEEATGLTDKQVLKALQGVSEARRDTDTGLWMMELSKDPRGVS
jgi:DNA translocase FtsK/SpoIIIE-like protein